MRDLRNIHRFRGDLDDYVRNVGTADACSELYCDSALDFIRDSHDMVSENYELLQSNRSYVNMDGRISGYSPADLDELDYMDIIDIFYEEVD